VEKRNADMTTGLRLGQLVNGRIIPSIAELRARWDRLYPAVNSARRPAMLVCECCGHRVAPGRINDPAYQRRTISGRRLGRPDDVSPDEYVTICPECGASENFREAAYE